MNSSDNCRSECVRPILDSFDYHEKCKKCPLECDSLVFEQTSKKILLGDDNSTKNNKTKLETLKNLSID